MSEELEKAVAKRGLEGVALGFAVGFLADRLVEWLYVTFVPESSKPKLPIFALDDWLLILLGVAMILSEKYRAFGFGWLVAVILSSGIIPRP